jgi:hypothetical protein
MNNLLEQGKLGWNITVRFPAEGISFSSSLPDVLWIWKRGGVKASGA